MLWASLAFAVMAAASHRAGEHCDWQLVVVARASLAFLFAVIIAKLSGVKLVFRGPKTLWVRSFAGSASMLCNFYGLAHLPVSDTLTLMNTSPIWVTLLLWLVFQARAHAGDCRRGADERCGHCADSAAAFSKRQIRLPDGAVRSRLYFHRHARPEPVAARGSARHRGSLFRRGQHCHDTVSVADQPERLHLAIEQLLFRFGSVIAGGPCPALPDKSA